MNVAKQKSLTCLLLIVGCFFSLPLLGQSPVATQVKRVIPFTTQNSVKLEVTFHSLPIASTRYAIKIWDEQSGKVIFNQPVSSSSIQQEENKMVFVVKGLSVETWTPTTPKLYQLSFTLTTPDKKTEEQKERVGFRYFESKNGNLYLNGKPIFLRGIAINPPGRGIPSKLEQSREFALDYVRFMKSINVNIIRIPDAEEWFDVCDELGMMVFGGNYGGSVAGGEKVEAQAKVSDETDGGFPSDYNKGVAWYKNEKLGAIAHHPSLMVYAMTNETPFAGKRAELWEKFLAYAFQQLKQWDDTRVYIANAGYGYGKTGDITDLHRYWGWYYSSPFTFLHIRDEAKINPYPSKHQPITFTECVGNYTGPDGRYNLTPAHKNPSSQLAWTGHERQDLQSQLADYHQSFTFRQATESFRQLRTINQDLSGVFPFTILFYNWNTITNFDDMKPKPVTEQVKTSYQPILLSWECWTPNVYAGAVLKPIAHIINDDNGFNDLTNAKLVYELKDKAYAIVFSDSVSLPAVPYYSTAAKKLEIKLPAHLTTGKYELIGKIVRNGEVVSQNYYRLFIADDYFTRAASNNVKAILLYDKQGITKKALSQLNIKCTEVSSFTKLPTNSFLIIGENAADAGISDNKNQIKKYIASGGRVLTLRQDSVHLQYINDLLLNPVTNNNIDIDDPVYPVPALSPRNGYYVNPERPEHPVFAGITRDNLRVWSDYTAWDETQKGFPAIKPVTDGFNLENKNDVGQTAILANYSSGLQAIALAEQFQGNGSIILCGLDLANRNLTDPVATRLLINLVQYTGSTNGHELYPIITSPIVWGEYETEKGVVTDLYSGFLVNSTPRVDVDYLGKGIVVTKEGYQLAGGSRSGFNTRPGIQYVANGRRPFGPFAQSFGGTPTPLNLEAEGVGKFWCRIPEGQNLATSIVWNPGKEPLVIKVKVNDLPEVQQTIGAGEKIVVETPVDNSQVTITYTGDRRLVILETTFSRKEQLLLP